MTTKVLIVDDNELYRTAFRRNLMLQNYEVVEAEHADEASQVYEKEKPDIVVTDLSMRTPTEGLDLIRSLKQVDPLVPVVLISAVGTFEEGSLAKELGADRVLMKQKIDEHIEELYEAIEKAKENGVKLRKIRREVEEISSGQEEVSPKQVARLREIISMPNQHPVILAEAYDAMAMATEQEVRSSLENEMNKANDMRLGEVERNLQILFPNLEKFSPDTIKELKTAEYFYTQQEGENQTALSVDFSRNIGFSYCFAVENEAKVRLRKKLNRFLADKNSVKLIRNFIDGRTGQMDIFYHQHLLRLEQQINFDFTVDNVRQVFQRIIEHEGRYKPDGLKALGIMIVCFGRTYNVKSMRGEVKVQNPIHLKAFETEEDTLRFAQLLVSLQHFRNPYIHPEISEMEKVSKIRDTALECLEQISRIS
jgi:DNA-binding NarL/FixJ family response regulator